MSIRPQPVEACPGPGCGCWVEWTTLKAVLFARCRPGIWCWGRNLQCRGRAKHPHTQTFLWASPDDEQRQNIKAARETAWSWSLDKKMQTSASFSLLSWEHSLKLGSFEHWWPWGICSTFCQRSATVPFFPFSYLYLKSATEKAFFLMNFCFSRKLSAVTFKRLRMSVVGFAAGLTAPYKRGLGSCF